MKTIGIIEDHPLMMQGVQNIAIHTWKGCKIYLFDNLPKYGTDKTDLDKCDVIIADVHLREHNILEDLTSYQVRFPLKKIILFTSSHPWELGIDIGQFPFWGYVQKNANLAELTACLADTENNIKYIQESLEWEKTKEIYQGEIKLTKREIEILNLIKTGKTSKDISNILFLSELTIKSHRQNMMRKFDAHNIAELISKTNSKGK